MGYYIDPQDMSKEEFLDKYGSEVTAAQAREHHAGKDGLFVVCLVDNGHFKAAGICYSDDERDRFLSPDGRPRSWFLVRGRDLEPYMKGRSLSD